MAFCYAPRVTYEALLNEALALPEDERTALVNSLQQTLHARPYDEVEDAWAREVARRVEDIRNGTAELVPADEAIAGIREMLKNRRG